MGQRPVFLSVICGESQAAPGGARRPPSPSSGAALAGFLPTEPRGYCRGAVSPGFCPVGLRTPSPAMARGGGDVGGSGSRVPARLGLREAAGPRATSVLPQAAPRWAYGAKTGPGGGPGGAGARLPVGPPPDGFVRVPLGAPARAGGRGCGEAASPVQPPPQAPCMWPLPGRWRCSPSSRCSALFFRRLKGHCPGLVPGSRAGAGGGKRSVRWAQVPPPRAEPCATPGSRASVLVCPGQSWP